MESSWKDIIREKIHSIQTPLTVINGFIRVVDAETLPLDQQILHGAARQSMEKLKNTIEEIRKMVQ